MPGALLWGWDATNKVWIPLQVDASGYVKVDLTNVNLNDLGDVSVASPSDEDLLYYDNASSTWKARALVDADIPAGIARDAEVIAAIADHAGDETGVHGVGASTVESVAGSQAKVNTHNALVLSHLVHDNDNWFVGYGAETIEGLQARTNVPALTAISDPSSMLNVTDWYGASGAYRQSDADSDATHIEDDDANFPASIRWMIVKWASDSAGTANTGIGVINVVTDSDTLAIVKCSGADFAANYYYWIKHSELVIPVTGLYMVTAGVLFLPAEVDKIFQVIIRGYEGVAEPSTLASGALSTPIADYSKPMGSWLIPLTASQTILLHAYHTGTLGAPTLFYSAASHNPLTIFLLKQTA